MGIIGSQRNSIVKFLEPFLSLRMNRRALTDFFVRFILLFCALSSIIALFFIAYYLFKSSIFAAEEIGIWNLLSGDQWKPASTYNESFGAFNLIIATILVSFGAMVIAIPIGIGSAIFVSQLAHPRIRDFLKTSIELLAGVPSIVYGLFGVLVLKGWLEDLFDLSIGYSWLAGSIILGIMALPTIISVSEDAISSVGRELKEASLGLGATKWQTISKVIVPASISGITAAIILGIGRAVGETIAVMMVAGNTATLPEPLWDIFARIKPITAAIGIEMGEASGTHKSALFALAVILFFMVLLINSVAIYIMGKIKAKHLGLVKKECMIPGLKMPDNMRFMVFVMLILLLSLIVFFLFNDLIDAKFGIIAALVPPIWFLGFRTMLPYISYKWLHRGLLKDDMVNDHPMDHMSGPVILPDNMKDVLTFISRLVLVAVVFMLFNTWFGLVPGIVMAAVLSISLIGTRFLPPKISQLVAFTMIGGTMLLTVAALGLIMYYIISEGIGVMSWEFLSEPPTNLGRDGGIYPAIVGTAFLVMGAISIAMPIGIGAGIYLSEYAKEGRFIKLIRLGIDNLNGTPSIVFGLFGLAFLVIVLEMGISLKAGVIVVSLMILPTIIRTTEEAMKSVPQSMREGSLALGATKWETIRKVILPPAFPGIITGIILSIGRAAGETAPILFVASTFQSPGPVGSLDSSSMFLSTHIFYMIKEVPGGLPRASGTALVLLMIIMIIYSSAAILRRKFKNKTKW
ncbi:MAG: phosphate ABC transporter permease PstA [Thermoplasmatota archaeon]